MRSPVLFLIFNRPDTTKRVFETIKQAKPTKLYIAADGPRKSKPNEFALCEKTREIINEIDWDCEVKTLFRDDNLGCGKAVSDAIKWFFENEEEGIIIEDDVLPHPDFFLYCDEMLEKYRYADDVKFISGRNALLGKSVGVESYYFSAFNYVWGWAAWRRTWSIYDFTLKSKSIFQFQKALDFYFDDKGVKRFWKIIFKKLKCGQIDTWDYQLTISLWFDRALSVIPNINLVKNIGFGENATHTIFEDAALMNLDYGSILPLNHPNVYKQDKSADFELEVVLKGNTYSLCSYVKWNMRFYLGLMFRKLFK